MVNQSTSVADPLVKGLLQKIDTVRKTKPSDFVFLGTEVALCQEYGISRMTVRRALDDLVSQGLIVRRRAKGIFLPPPSSIQRVIKFVVPNLLHEHCVQFLKGIQSAIEDRNYTVQVHDANGDFEHAIELIDKLPRSPESGAIIISIHHPKFIQRLIALRESGYPFVILGNLHNVIDAPMVRSSHYECGYQMAKDLLAKGHRRFGHIAQFNSRANARLWEGLHTALNDVGIALPYSYRVGISEEIDPLSDWTPAIHEATQKLMELQEPPTAILYHDDRAALIAYKWFRSQGYRLPEDISVIGVGDSEMGHYAYPELASIRQPRFDAGIEAVNMLDYIIEHPNSNPGQKTLQADWICRESVAEARAFVGK